MAGIYSPAGIYVATALCDVAGGLYGRLKGRTGYFILSAILCGGQKKRARF